MNKNIILQTKSFDLDTREFVAYASVFNNVDLDNDKIVKGAFTKTIKDRKHMPAVFSNHDINSLPIGVITEMVEDDYGLLVKGIICDTQEGNDVYKLMKANALHSFSIGYKTVKSTDVNGVRVITEIKLYEVSIVNLIPANELAVLQQIKAADEQQTDADSSDSNSDNKQPTMQDVVNMINDVISRLDSIEQAVNQDVVEDQTESESESEQTTNNQNEMKALDESSTIEDVVVVLQDLMERLNKVEQTINNDTQEPLDDSSDTQPSDNINNNTDELKAFFAELNQKTAKINDELTLKALKQAFNV